MEETVQNEISLMDIMKMLVKKIKLLLCVTLIGVVVGAALGGVLTFNKKYYGTKARFYLSAKASDTQIIDLLESGSFAETLLLNEYNLPVTVYGTQEEYNVAVEKSKAVQAAEKTVEDLEESVESLPEEVKLAQDVYDQAAIAYENALAVLEAYASGNIPQNISPERFEEIELKHETAEATLEAAYDILAGKQNELLTAKGGLKAAENALKAAEAEFENASKKIMTAWRADKKVKKQMETIEKSVSYSYSGGSDKATNSLDVSISVLKDKAFAKTLYENIKAKVPAFVEKNLHVEEKIIQKDGKTETVIEDVEVSFLSTFNEVEQLNEGETLKKMITYGLILGIVSLLVACVVVVCAERWKKPVDEQQAEQLKIEE
ncbi:MAG: hypothetical protein IJF64_02110 [Clostridia bacterium]|nr:hypothetical protein [Clostridia bacterium]